MGLDVLAGRRGLWSVLKIVLIVIAVLLVLAFWEDILSIAIMAGFFAGGGALLFSIIGVDSGVGAIVGLCGCATGSGAAARPFWHWHR